MDSKLFLNHSDDLSYWEIVNSSDAEESVDGDIRSWSSLSSYEDGESEESILTIIEVESSDFDEDRDEVEILDDLEQEIPIMEVESPIFDDDRDKVENFNELEDEIPIIDDDRSKADNFNEIHTQESPIVENFDQYDVESEEENESEDYLNDELMPWGYMDRIGRERMRKLGKRSFAKMSMSKTKNISYTFNRAGCARGKHGLGLKHSL